MIRAFLVGIGLLIAGQASAYAGGSVWHWEKYGHSNYSGQIGLSDDQGAATYLRYGTAGSPSLFGSASVQSPITVVAGADIQVDIVRAGVVQTKKDCGATKTWRVYVTPVTACELGRSRNLSGIHAWAQNTSATTYTPRLSVHVHGSGWQQVNNTSCGNVQTIQVCE